MDSNKEIIISRISSYPKLFNKLSKNYIDDIDFCKKLVSANNKLFFKLPIDMQKKEEIVQIVLDSITTSDLKFPFEKLFVVEKKQNEQLKKICCMLGCIRLYDVLYGKNDFTSKNLLLKDLNIDQGIFLQVFELLNILPPFEHRLLTLKYGFYDGVVKSDLELSHILNVSKEKVRIINEQSLRSIRKYIFEINNKKQVIKW